jgi:hypothetical protein
LQEAAGFTPEAADGCRSSWDFYPEWAGIFGIGSFEVTTLF